jgi:peroxiredoxin
MQQVQKEFNQKGLIVLAVNMQEDRNRVANWVTEQKVTPLVLLDSDGAVAQLYGVTGVPAVVVIGRTGEMIGRAFGTRQWTGEKGRGLFEALLSPQAR